MEASNSSPKTIVAWGMAVALGLLALGVALSYVIPAIGVAVGTAGSIISTGAAVGVSVTPAMVTAATYGTAAIGAAGAIHVTVRVAEGMKKQPLAWGAPILGLLSGFLVQSCEKYWFGPAMMWPVFAAAAGALVLIGGIFYAGKSVAHKIFGVLASLVPPAIVFVTAKDKEGRSVFNAYSDISLDLWAPLLLMLICAGVLGAVAHLDHKRSQ